MNSRILGVIGSLLLAAGVFLPIASVGDLTLNYFKNEVAGIESYGDGIIILPLAVLSLIFALVKLNRVLIVTGLLALGLMVYDIINVKNNTGGIAKLEWGWAVLLLGVLLVIVAGIMKKPASATPPSYAPPPPGYPPGPGQPPPPYNR